MKVLIVGVRKYIRKWAGKKTPIEMAIDLKVSKSCVVSHANAMKRSLVLKEIIEENKKIDKLINEYGATKTVREMCLIGNVKPYQVRSRGYKRGIVFKKEKEPVKPKLEVQNKRHLFNETKHENWLI